MKGQFFLLFALLLLIPIAPLFLTETHSSSSTPLAKAVKQHTRQMPAALNAIAFSHNSTRRPFALRHFLELERQFFTSRLADFSALTVVGFANTSLEVYVANYNTSQSVTVTVNNVSQTETLAQGEIATISFSADTDYSVSVKAHNSTYAVTTQNDMWYLSHWHISRRDTKYNVVRSG